jgi:hypothetical protein
MLDQEVCLLRYECLVVKNGFLHLSKYSTWQWVAYLEKINVSNVILRSPEVFITDTVLTTSKQLIKNFQQNKEHSYFKIDIKLRKQNWKPAAFDIDGMATTFLRNK